MDDELRSELVRRVEKGRRAFKEVQQLILADPVFAATVESLGAGGLPLVLFDLPDAPEPFRRMVATDRDNSDWFARLVALRGWPGVTLVGDDGVAAAWELAMHADTAQNERAGWLAVVARAAELGEVPHEHAELLRLRTEAVAAITDR